MRVELEAKAEEMVKRAIYEMMEDGGKALMDAHAQIDQLKEEVKEEDVLIFPSKTPMELAETLSDVSKGKREQSPRGAMIAVLEEGGIDRSAVMAKVADAKTLLAEILPARRRGLLLNLVHPIWQLGGIALALTPTWDAEADSMRVLGACGGARAQVARNLRGIRRRSSMRPPYSVLARRVGPGGAGPPSPRWPAAPGAPLGRA